MKRPRLTIGAALVAIAAFAVLFSALRAPSEARAVEIAIGQFLRDEPGVKRDQVEVTQRNWNAGKRRWEMWVHNRQMCVYTYHVGPLWSCRRAGMSCL